MAAETRRKVTLDGNSAVSQVAYALSEVICIYPITPSSTMGENADEYAAKGKTNIWGTIPSITEMQSEGGAVGAIHGAMATGALTTTFTASQGLLLMIPNMYKIAGELTPAVIHVSARAIAAHALSIFGDHQDVMACRQTGWAMLASGSVLEAQDMALIAHSATLTSRVPFLHFFDGFRTSHEVQKIEELTKTDMASMINEDEVFAHRRRALSPDHPTIKGTAQNPDVYFQGREAANPFYTKVPGIVQNAMDKFAKLTGRAYKLFDYVGHPQAENVIIAMGSGAEVAHEYIEWALAKGEKIGLLKVRLFRPFSIKDFVAALPKTVKKIAVLDRTKESGSAGEPLYQDVQTALFESIAEGTLKAADLPLVVSGRYGLGSKEFNTSMVKAVFDNLAAAKPKNHFVVGIEDDVGKTSLAYDAKFSTEDEHVHRAIFFGLGSDGTVGANKNTIKIIGESTDNYAQGYFVYDSKKAGSMTTSHLRFSKKPIRSSYLINQAEFVACHTFPFLFKFDMLKVLKTGGTFLLNTSEKADKVWDVLPVEVQQALIAKKAKFFVIDAYSLAEELGLGARINTIMQTAHFVISQVIPESLAIGKIEDAIKKSYGTKGDKIVKQNLDAVAGAKARLVEVKVPATAGSKIRITPHSIPASAPDFIKNVSSLMIAYEGDLLTVGQMPVDGTFPTDTAKYEKRNIALKVPCWNPEACIQCTQCSFVCPHAAIRAKCVDADALKGAPASFKAIKAMGKGADGKPLDSKRFIIQVAPEDCTGCGNCVVICPGRAKDAAGKKIEDQKAIMMQSHHDLVEAERKNFEFFLSLPETDLASVGVNRNTVKGSQLLRPLFEFSGACAGCGETPYIKAITQLFGDRMIIANATGCTSIYGGNLPTTPYAKRNDGRGPAWANSLFEDNAEFGLGMRLASDKLGAFAQEMLLKSGLDAALVEAITKADVSTQEGIEAKRALVAKAKTALTAKGTPEAKRLIEVIDFVVPRSVWIFGGDGWAYDIGFGGLDHVLASGNKVNILCVDTGVYSNTGGQASKSTPRGAAAKFAFTGKEGPRKDLGAMMMSYGTIYVAQIAMGASMPQTIKAIQEAESYPGSSLIIAYAHCIAHGITMTEGNALQKQAVETGFWPLYRFDPRLSLQGKNPLQLDSKAPAGDLADFAYHQSRWKSVKAGDAPRAANLLEGLKGDIAARWKFLERLAAG